MSARNQMVAGETRGNEMAMVSVFKFYGAAQFYAHTGTEQDDRSAAVFYALGRADGGDLFSRDGAFRFADSYALAKRYASLESELRAQGMRHAFDEWMRDGRVSVVNRWTHERVAVPTD